VVAGPAAAAEPLTIDPNTVGVLESLALRYQRLYHATPPAQLLIPVTAHLELVEEVAKAVDRDWQRRGLHRNRSQVALLAGRLSFFDLHDPMAARGYYGMALESAREAADRDLAAGVLGHMSFVPAAHGSFRAALDDLDTAIRLAASTSILSSWLPAVASEVHAKAGEASASLGAIARAEDALATGVEVPVWLDYYDATRLHGFEGYALLAARKPAAACAALDAAVTGLDSAAVKQRSAFLADQATSFVLEGEVDEGCRHASQAAEQLASAGYATSTERLREFRALVAPWQDRIAVKDLDERLALI
jgi:hypothetical protein